jgi:hypothetical protein
LGESLGRYNKFDGFWFNINWGEFFGPDGKQAANFTRFAVGETNGNATWVDKEIELEITEKLDPV